RHERCIFTEDVDFEIRKGERAHLLARVIMLLVSIKNFLPTAGDAVTAHELSLGRTIVAIHVTFNIATIPGGSLCVEHRADDRFCLTGSLSGGVLADYAN